MKWYNIIYNVIYNIIYIYIYIIYYIISLSLYIYIYILFSGFAHAADPFGKEVLETKTCKSYWILSIFSSFWGPQITILGSFEVPWAPFWSHFAMKWVADAHGGTLEGPRVDFQWFLTDFGFPSGQHFGSLFHIFCHLKLKHHKKRLACRHYFWWSLNGKSADFWGPNLVKV